MNAGHRVAAHLAQHREELGLALFGHANRTTPPQLQGPFQRPAGIEARDSISGDKEADAHNEHGIRKLHPLASTAQKPGEDTLGLGALEVELEQPGRAWVPTQAAGDSAGIHAVEATGLAQEREQLLTEIRPEHELTRPGLRTVPLMPARIALPTPQYRQQAPIDRIVGRTRPVGSGRVRTVLAPTAVLASYAVRGVQDEFPLPPRGGDIDLVTDLEIPKRDLFPRIPRSLGFTLAQFIQTVVPLPPPTAPARAPGQLERPLEPAG